MYVESFQIWVVQLCRRSWWHQFSLQRRKQQNSCLQKKENNRRNLRKFKSHFHVKQTCLYGKKFTHEYCTNSCANIPVCAIVNMCGFEYQKKLVLYLNFYTIVFLKIKKFLIAEERNSLFPIVSLFKSPCMVPETIVFDVTLWRHESNSTSISLCMQVNHSYKW